VEGTAEREPDQEREGAHDVAIQVDAVQERDQGVMGQTL